MSDLRIGGTFEVEPPHEAVLRCPICNELMDLYRVGAHTQVLRCDKDGYQRQVFEMVGE